MQCHFVVGQRVVCIDGNWDRPTFRARVMRQLFPRTNSPRTNEVCQIEDILLRRGIVWLIISGKDGWLYSSDCFRPLPELKTDISEFERILADVNARVPIVEPV